MNKAIIALIILFIHTGLYSSQPITDTDNSNQNNSNNNQSQQQNYTNQNEASPKKYRNYKRTFKMTIIGASGTTAVNDGLTTNSQENITVGGQFLYCWDYRNVVTGIGLEVARQNIYQFSIYSNENAHEFVNVQLIAEANLYAVDWFGMMLQIGLGPMIGIQSTSSSYYSTQYSMGLIFKPLDFLTIQPVVRSDWIFLRNNQIIGSLSAQLGLGFHIDLD